MTGPPLRGDHDTLAGALEAAAQQFSGREAYVQDGERVTFSAWVERADAVAAGLQELGVRPGDVVALMLPSSIDYAVCHAAVARAGAVTTGLNPRLGPTEVASILDRAAPRVIIGDCPVPTAVPVVPPAWVRAARPAAPVRVAVDPDDPAVIIWTSGTTGLPKGAWFDHRNLAAAVWSAGAMTAPFDRRLMPVPFAHAGYMAKLWEQLAWGTTIVISPTPWTAASMLQLLVDERITVAGAVPAQWAKLVELPGVRTADVSALRLGLAATAPAPPALVARVRDVLGVPVVVRYAMTESPSVTGTEPDDPPEVQFRTVGRPQTGMSVSVVGADGAEVAAGEVGRVRVRGECVMRGYWGDPSSVLDADGWLVTGDLGSFDPAGNLVLSGRVSDLYIRGGYNVYPAEVEAVLATHPAVEAAAVVGIEAPVIGEIGVAFVVPAAGATPSLDDLRGLVRSRLADYKAPDRMVVVDELPLTAMLKVDKRALRALA